MSVAAATQNVSQDNTSHDTNQIVGQNIVTVTWLSVFIWH